MSNQYWQVLRTYLERPRFWVLGTTYLLIVCFWFWYYDWDLSAQRQIQAIFSSVFANLVACFLALHVRRQFSHAAAQTTPNYAVPHLLVGGAVCAVLWLLIPGIAVWTGHWAPGALPLHAIAGILAGIVACWPRGVLLVMAIPLVAIWDFRPVPPNYTALFVAIYRGDYPVLAAGLILLAVIAQVVAVLLLLRLPRKGSATNDEFTIEAPTAAEGVNPLYDWLLEMRASEAERLARTSWLPLVQRWRAPVAITPVLLLLPPALVGAGALFGWWYEEPTGWTFFMLILTCAILLLVPVAPWQMRRVAMSQELLRPVARERYFRQVLAAMALDVVTWIGIAALIILVVMVARWPTYPHPDRTPIIATLIAISLSLLVSMAVFVFGVAVATLRWRFSLPMVAGITTGWFFGVWASLLWIGHLIARDIGSRGADAYTPYFFVGFCLMTTVVGVALTIATYRRWVRSDVV